MTEPMSLRDIALRAGLRTLAGSTLVIALGACATLASPPTPGYEQYVAAAEAANVTGDADAALAAWHRAASADPTRKQAWQEIAALQAADGQWAQALAASQAVLQLDPEDAAAAELFIDASLRLARQALQRLAQGGPEQVDANRNEAEALLAQLVEVFGEAAIPSEVRQLLGKGAVDKYKARLPRPAAPDRQTPQVPEKAADPFDILGGD